MSELDLLRKSRIKKDKETLQAISAKESAVPQVTGAEEYVTFVKPLADKLKARIELLRNMTDEEFKDYLVQETLEKL